MTTLRPHRDFEARDRRGLRARRRRDDCEQASASRTDRIRSIAPTDAIRNPILPGFNPDPSILRVGDDYYIATSTFEWYPGVQIHHSQDLANWELRHPAADPQGAARHARRSRLLRHLGAVPHP